MRISRLKFITLPWMYSQGESQRRECDARVDLCCRRPRLISACDCVCVCVCVCMCVFAVGSVVMAQSCRRQCTTWTRRRRGVARRRRSNKKAGRLAVTPVCRGGSANAAPQLLCGNHSPPPPPPPPNTDTLGTYRTPPCAKGESQAFLK